jgi:hypothetical protein
MPAAGPTARVEPMVEHFKTNVSRWGAFAGTVLAASIGIAALGSSIGIPALPEPLAELDRRLPGIFQIHMMTSGLALILLPWILVLRHRRTTHRFLGRIGSGLLLIGTAASVPSALYSDAVPLARLGFLTQGVLCLLFLVGAELAIRARNIQRHAQLMLWVSALVFGAVVLRLLMALAMQFGLIFDAAYGVVAWLSWALPLATVLLWPTYKNWRANRFAPTLHQAYIGVEEILDNGPNQRHARANIPSNVRLTFNLDRPEELPI